jgi:hypothetical protein
MFNASFMLLFAVKQRDVRACVLVDDFLEAKRFGKSDMLTPA